MKDINNIKQEIKIFTESFEETLTDKNCSNVTRNITNPEKINSYCKKMNTNNCEIPCMVNKNTCVRKEKRMIK
jgi:hypothetical protein